MAEFELRKLFLSNDSPGRPGDRNNPMGLVIHWTANTDPGADAVANRNYFNSSSRGVSTHYIVDDKMVVQCLPEDEIAYHAGAESYSSEILNSLCDYPNSCTIGIEMCVNSDGDFQKTYQNTVSLSGGILKRYNWGKNDLWRHHDITGKDCPRYFVYDSTAKSYGFNSAREGWEQFKEDVDKILKEEEGGGNVSKFTDLEGHWAREEIERAYQLGLVSGREEDKFVPNEYLTRAEGTVLLMRLYDLIENK